MSDLETDLAARLELAEEIIVSLRAFEKQTNKLWAAERQRAEQAERERDGWMQRAEAAERKLDEALGQADQMHDQITVLTECMRRGPR